MSSKLSDTSAMAFSADLQKSAYLFSPMCIEDIDEVMQIETSVYPFPWTYGNFTDSLKSGYWGTCLRNPSGQLLAYSLSMMVVDEAHLLNVAVANAYQGQGFCQQLLRQLCWQAQQANLQSILLEVRPSNLRALRTYERFGFTPVGKRKGYYPQSEAGGVEDAVVMRLQLAVQSNET